MLGMVSRRTCELGAKLSKAVAGVYDGAVLGVYFTEFVMQ